MINKKPFRVTNEQAKKIYTTYYNFRDQVTGATTHDLAADLLDSRELIDKQEALIKEMRGELEEARMVMEKYEAQLTGELFNDPSLNDILEKTKDYA